MNTFQVNPLEEFWVVRRILVKGETEQKAALRLTNELFELVEKESIKTSKHYFWEADEGFHIRIEVDSFDTLKKIENLIDNKINTSIFKSKTDSYPYSGEWNDWIYKSITRGDQPSKGYGIAWVAAKKFFEASCLLKLSKMFHEKELRMDNFGDYNKKLVHCFLNQQYDGNIVKERNFHVEEYKRKSENAIKEREGIIDFLLNTINLAKNLEEVKEKISKKLKIKFDK